MVTELIPEVACVIPVLVTLLLEHAGIIHIVNVSHAIGFVLNTLIFRVLGGFELPLDLLLVVLILVLLEAGVAVEVVVVTDLITHGVHHDIDTDDLVEFADAQLAQRLHRLEVDVARASDPGADG